MARDIVFKGQGVQLVEARFGKPIDQVLRELYEEQRLTQGQIADELGVRPATVSRWMQVFGIESRYLGQRVKTAIS